VDEHNVPNIAPYGMVMPVSYHPLIISVGSAKDRDTFRNINSMGEFVINAPTVDLLRKVNRTADPIPSNQDEFIHANLTPIESKVVKPPRIEECSTHMECKMLWIKEASTEVKERVIITAEVVALSIDKGLFLKNLCKQKGQMKPLFYEKNSYFTLGGYVGDRRLR
jgi:flavin reductase (DIM6/NTAB) family NADH-FMN oxidoreductase RutF